VSPSVAAVIPLYNKGPHIERALRSALEQTDPPDEIIVVDDASTDETPSVAAQLGARVLRLSKNSGPAAARNHGAAQAHGDVLFFVDADVVIARGAVDRVRTVLAEHPTVAAVFGSYDATPRADGIVSRYRNLLHHFVHQNGQAEASTFWAGCGAIRRAVFQDIGGFDARRFPRPSIEDIELGHRLRQAGHRIRLDKTIQGTHLKRWDLGSLVHTDITRRAIPWSRLILANKTIPNTLNLAWDQRVSAALVAVAGVLLLLPGNRLETAALTAAALATVVILNRKLYRLFFQQGGLWFTMACVTLHLLYYAYSGLSYLFAWFEHRVVGRFATRDHS
jgi:glycosyltransferase involved in cell wall biosynthesis